MASHVHRLAFIDSLRAIAILGVISVHTAHWVVPGSDILHRAAEEGARGVQLFFMASALTIFLSMKSRMADEYAPMRNYFIRRFFRIAPLFYFGIAIWLLILGLEPRYWAPNGIDGWTIFLTATFLNGFHPETITSVVPGGWSIAVEMTFYLVAPLLFLHIKDMTSAIALLLAAILANYILTNAVTAYWIESYPPDLEYLARSYGLLWFVAQFPVFVLGMIVFHSMGGRFGTLPRLLGYVLLALAMVLWVAFLDVRSYLGLIPQHLYYSASFVLLMISLAVHPTRLLVNPVMCRLGKISFSLYIFHFIVLHVLDTVMYPDGFALQGDAGYFAALCLVLVASSALSLMTYRFVERPGIGLGAYVVSRFEQRSARQNAENSLT